MLLRKHLQVDAIISVSTAASASVVLIPVTKSFPS